MSLVNKLAEAARKTKDAVDRFLACSWCGAVERECVCGKWESEPPEVTQ
ncbi:hypothetical protein [Lentzea sp. NPDC003310]